MILEQFVRWLIEMGDGPERSWQTRAASRTGLSQGFISRVASGHRKGSIGLDTVERIADHMGYRPWQILFAIEECSKLPPKTLDDPRISGR